MRLLAKKYLSCASLNLQSMAFPTYSYLITDHNSSAKNSTSFQNSTNLNHKTSTPYYPQSNGKSTIKSLLRQSVAEKSNFQLSLLKFCNTPTNEILGSPTQRLMGRRTRTLLHTTEKLRSKTIPPSQVQLQLCSQKSIQKRHYDKQAKTHSTKER